MKRVFLFACLLILFACIALYFWFASDSYYIRTDKSLDGNVALSFTLALMENKDVKPLVAQRLWPEIDDWMIKHEVFNCPSFWPLNDGSSDGGVEGIDLDTVRYTMIQYKYCSGVEGHYSFEIKDLVLKRFDGEWVVYGWGEICEKRPGETACHNPLENKQ